MNFYIYILYSPSGDRYYVGYTDDVARRLEEHNHLSERRYTSKYRPWELRGNIEGLIRRFSTVGYSGPEVHRD